MHVVLPITMLISFQKSLLVKAVLDTTMHGSDIDASLLLISNYDECREPIIVGDSSDETDSGITKAPKKSLYKLISDSNVDVSLTSSLCNGLTITLYGSTVYIWIVVDDIPILISCQKHDVI